MHTAYSAADDYGKDMEERVMEIQVRKLTKEMADAYLNFFDQDAFSDHVEWSACYCLESHLDREENERLKGIKETVWLGGAMQETRMDMFRFAAIRNTWLKTVRMEGP